MQLSNTLITSYKKLPHLFLDGTVFCSIDTETSGLHSKTDRIIEIGAVKFCKDGIIDRYSTLVNPQTPLSQLITEITGITDQDLKDKPYIKDIFPSFLDFIKDTILIGHNIQFDLHFINNELQRASLKQTVNQAIDTLILSRLLYKNTASWKLHNLAKEHNINILHAHRALDDARVCMELFTKEIFEIQNNGLKRKK